MLKCTYFKKHEFDFKELVSSLTTQDIKYIARKLGRTYHMVSQYASIEEEFADRKVPQKFIDVVNKLKEKKKKERDKIENAIKNNN